MSAIEQDHGPIGGGSSAGAVTSGANITDNAIVRGDGGAKGVQGSLATVDDNGSVNIPDTQGYQIAGATMVTYNVGGARAILGAAVGRVDLLTGGALYVMVGATLKALFTASLLLLDLATQLVWGTAGVDNGDTGLGRHSAGVLKGTNAGTSITGFIGGGAAVASAAALPLPTGRIFHVTGTTNITSIIATNLASGVVITLIFDGILTLTAGNNLKMAGNFVTTANDTWTAVFDGTNFYEISRAVVTN